MKAHLTPLGSIKGDTWERIYDYTVPDTDANHMISFGGTGAYLTIPDSDAWNMTDLTFEAEVRWDSTRNNQTLCDIGTYNDGTVAAQATAVSAKDAAVIAKNAAEAAAATINIHKYDRSFVNADLAVGVLTVTHNLNSEVVSVVVLDNSKKKILPSEITVTGVNTLTVDLLAFGTLTGTWNVKVMA